MTPAIATKARLAAIKAVEAEFKGQGITKPPLSICASILT